MNLVECDILFNSGDDDDNNKQEDEESYQMDGWIPLGDHVNTLAGFKHKIIRKIK